MEKEKLMELPETPHQMYPAAMVNITNHCTLRCRHCFVFRDGNPNDPAAEMDSKTMVETLAELQKRHKILTMLWMGGEPLLRPDVLREGTRLFARNHVTTNGTLELIELPRTIYVVSIDGPEKVNDEIRGQGSFAKVMRTLSKVPKDFSSTVMCQCVVTTQNQDHLEELAVILREAGVAGLTFSFYVPRREDDSGLSWGSLERRDPAVREAIRLKRKYPDFIWNKMRGLELTLSANSPAITANCMSKRFVLPLYLEGSRFVIPFCCYGNDVDCDLCGAWVVFNIAAKLMEGSATDYLATDGLKL